MFKQIQGIDDIPQIDDDVLGRLEKFTGGPTSAFTSPVQVLLGAAGSSTTSSREGRGSEKLVKELAAGGRLRLGYWPELE